MEGNSAWTPVENTYNNFLIFDLGEKRNTRKIATMGRPFTNEYVTEYIVQYSDDGEYWRSYVNPASEPQVTTEKTRKRRKDLIKTQVKKKNFFLWIRKSHYLQLLEVIGPVDSIRV